MEKRQSPLTPVFPFKDIDRIMRSVPNIDENTPVDKRDLLLVSKATELFLKQFIQDIVDRIKNCDKLEYDDFVAMIHEDGGKYNFLQQIVPKKITVKEYREIMAKKEAEEKKKEAEEMNN